MLNSKAKQCTAKNRSGCRCKNPAMANGKCRIHGGLSTGAPKGNKNSAKPGSIYSKFMTDEELDILDQVDLDNLDQEIKVYRIRLYRLLAEEQKQKDELELKVRTTQTPVVGGLPVTAEEGEDEDLIETKQYAKRDYHALINQTTARLQSLIQMRQALTGQKLDIELKQLQLNAANGEDGEQEEQKITIEVVDARKRDKNA